VVTGITCLFVASKIEEIYPPKLSVFAYVTDGACTEAEIMDMELVVMKTLKWKLNPITPSTWISVYLQVLSHSPIPHRETRSGDTIRSLRLSKSMQTMSMKPDDASLIKPAYNTVEFVRIIRIMDLTMLELSSLQFTYSMLAAAAFYHIKGMFSSTLLLRLFANIRYNLIKIHHVLFYL